VQTTPNSAILIKAGSVEHKVSSLSYGRWVPMCMELICLKSDSASLFRCVEYGVAGDTILISDPFPTSISLPQTSHIKDGICTWRCIDE
jgi:hypothetical protein